MNQNKTLLIGALIAEKTGTETAISAGEGIQLGVMVLGLLRAIASLGDEK